MKGCRLAEESTVVWPEVGWLNVFEVGVVLGVECVPGLGVVSSFSQARDWCLCGQRIYLTEKAFQIWPCLY